MPEFPQDPNLTQSMLDATEIAQRRGNTLAMSTIGDPCRRKLWFSLHWVGPVSEITLRLSNLFATGANAEDFIVKDLESIGITITDRQEELWGFAKHEHGFTDGRANNVPEAPKTQHLLEIKTHNDKYFKQLVKQGVKKGFPKHYAQCTRYMTLTKLKRTLYIGYNKNTSEYYVERLRYDAGYAKDLEYKARDIILSSVAPDRIFDASWFECKWCDFNKICHGNQQITKSCRTCEHVDMCDDGIWECGLNGGGHNIPKQVQETGCHLYKCIEITR